jgi:DNA polymerase III epsilon subunit-like protein
MFLFFDVETNGLPKNYKAPASDLKNWPYIVQLAATLYSRDRKPVAAFNSLIYPEDFTISDDTFKVHGISQSYAESYGVSILKVLPLFSAMVSNAGYVVAHNYAFDSKIVSCELLRSGLEDCLKHCSFKPICTMLATTSYCQLPGNYGYKWPKLSELHRKLFDKDFEGAHDAGADVQALANCFFELVDRDIIVF